MHGIAFLLKFAENCNYALSKHHFVMAISRININPTMLSWAVERFGGNTAEYAEENSKFDNWMNGDKLPTLIELQKFAKKFYVPLGYLFLSEPPKETDLIPLFRRSRDKKMGLNIREEVKTLEERQDWLSDYLRGEGFDKLDYVGIFQADSSVNDICIKIEEILHLPINWAFEYRTVEKALNMLTQIIEDKGVIVSFTSMVGYCSNRPINVSDCRGFTLVNDYAPFIYVNSKDAKYAQVFTLIHEFAHVLIGYSAGIGGEDLSYASELERLCDQVAASFLVNEDLLKEEWCKVGENYEVLSKRFKVSRFVLARRLKDIGLIDERRYYALYKQWMAEPVIPKKKTDGGVFYPTAIKRCSRTFLIHLDNALSSFKIQNMDAYRLAGLKGDTFRNVISNIK